METAVVAALASVVQVLHDLACKVQENKEQCLRLCLHINSILDVLEAECKNGVPPMLLKRINKLSEAVLNLTMTLEGLHKSSFLQRVIWRHQVSSKIQELYRYISEAVQDLKLGMAFDANRAQAENEQARQLDAANTRTNFDQLLTNDKEIIEALEVQQQQMQETIVCLHRYLEHLPESSERLYLRNGMHTMQRRSGNPRLVPDVFVITSLDVIIHYDKKLGEGGFTRVYEGLWGGTKVAVKVMEKGIPASAIQQEVDVWKRLRHPHILEFYGACSIADPPFMVCAHKKNGDAVDYLRRFPNANRHQLLYEAAIGLIYLHQNGIVHGDIKASNILVDEYGRACLSDFGLSQIKIHTTTIHGTGNGTQHGTARWMAPEHMLQGVISKKTDVYSFGMTMFEVFSGFPPFAATPESMLIQVVCDRKIRPARPEDPSVNGLTNELWELMCRTWAHEPEQRLIASDLLTQLARHASMVHLDSEDEEVIAVQNPSDPVVGIDLPAFWRDQSMNYDHRPDVRLEAPEVPGHWPYTPTSLSRKAHATPASTSLETEHSSSKSRRAAPPLPSNSHARSRSTALELPTSQYMGSTRFLGKDTPGKDISSRPRTRQGSEASSTPYISRAAREFIDFLDEGPPQDDDPGDGTLRSTSLPTTPKKTSAFAQIPQRLKKISKRQRSLDVKAANNALQASPPPETSPKLLVSPDFREFIDFLEEGPPETADTSSSPSPSKQPSPNGSTFRNKLQPLGRLAGRQRPRNISVDSPDFLDTSPLLEPRNSLPSAGSRGSGSQPYISQSARDLVEFLDEGPPLELRKRQRDGSTASAESAKSMTSFQRLRGILSRNPGHSAQGSDETDLLLSGNLSRPLSTSSSLDMFALPIPGVFDEDAECDGSVVSASGALQHLQPIASNEGAGSESLAEPSGENSQDGFSDSTAAQEVAQALVLSQPMPPVSLTTPALVVLSSLALYILFSMPIS